MIYLGVIGGATCAPHVEALAEAVGREIGKRRAVLVCGGLGGVMEAAARGASSCGGLTVGILPGTDRSSANLHIRIAIPTGLGEVRNALVARASDGLIAVDGSYGTLSEIAFGLQMGRPVVGLDTWQLDAPIVKASSAAEAVEVVLKAIRRSHQGAGSERDVGG